MMRKVLVAAALFASPALITPALALQGSDTMSAWRGASEADRSELMKQLPAAVNKPAVRKCMDETASVQGHAELPIAEVAKVCAKSEGAGQPV